MEKQTVETEGSLVYFNRDLSMTIRVYPQVGLGLEPHFIILDNDPPDTTKKIGIAFREPKYVLIPLKENESHWILNDEEKKFLCHLLKKRDRLTVYGKREKLLIWNSIILHYNVEMNDLNLLNYKNLPIPNYLDL